MGPKTREKWGGVGSHKGFGEAEGPAEGYAYDAARMVTPLLGPKARAVFHSTATTEIYTLPLHGAIPIP